MRLIDLEAEFIQHQVRDDGTYLVPVDALNDAHGVKFLCPKCFHTNKGKVGTHIVICWFKGKVTDDVDPSPGRWNPSGIGLLDLTFVPPGAVSVLLTGGCNWHGFVRNGEATLS